MRLIIALLLSLSFYLTAWPVGAYAAADLPTPEPSIVPGDGGSIPAASPDAAIPTGEPSPPPQVEPVSLVVDNQNLYENMTRPYSKGYVPTVDNGSATLVLPLLCSGRLRGDTLRAKVVMDASGPFAPMNYEKTIPLAQNKVNGGKSIQEGYLATFTLPLRPNRVNGSYPVAVSVSAQDVYGNTVGEDFTIYVTVTDGEDPDATPVPEPDPTPEPIPTPEPVVLGPKILVQSCRAFSLEDDATEGIINAGDRMQVIITLLNTSKTEPVENMAVTAASPGEAFSLLSAADSIYVGDMAAGATVELTYEYSTRPETPAGQYQIPISYDFAYDNGQTGSGSGAARISIAQPLELELAMLQIPKEAVISDTVRVNFQAVNLSHAKAYNVRASIEGDGLLPSGTAYIGDLDGGGSAEKDLQLLITGLTDSVYSYGQTAGTITYLYEDASGQEYTETGSFTMEIRSPFSSDSGEKTKTDEPGQWWVIMAAIGAGALALGGALAWREVRRRRQ